MTVMIESIPSLPEPDQPPESSWRFVDDLQSPMWSKHNWPPRTAHAGEVSLAGGVQIQASFEAPGVGELLATAYEDLRAFLRAGNVALDGDYPIQTRRNMKLSAEQYQIDVNQRRCEISASDTEGIRRGIFHIEDLMRRAGGPFLPLGTIERKPVIRTRISRCFFGPINRPPMCRDELTDDVNYYPDEYLNRLAHDGVNALWLTIKFRDLCRSKYFPSFAPDAERRLEKLRQTVERCARYGIQIYPFCIEPTGFGEAEYLTDREEVVHEELLGHVADHHTNLCTSSALGQAYLEEATHALFSAVPDLGGLIAIQLGERPTHCYSEMSQLFKNNCPRCCKRTPGEVFADTWAAMARGMHKVNPQAELISWLYTPVIKDTPDSTMAQKMDMLEDIAGHATQNMTLQVNFESGGQTEQFGGTHPIDDYSLSYIGPSENFRRCARAAAGNGGHASGKLQVGNSHEVATTPCVPVPGNLYKKYKTLHELGASAVMQCWYFGNYPSVMTKAAGLLSFAPFPDDEDQFLHELARIDWGDSAGQVVQAWKYFQEGYAQFPATLNFSWFGPIHDCATWPLHLVPVNQPIAPSWKFGYPISGDRVGECVGYELTMPQCLELCQNMAQAWGKGAAILNKLSIDSLQKQEQLNVANALNLQFTSAWHVMTFYSLREKLPYQNQDEQLTILEQMRDIVLDEIVISRQLAELAEQDSRLGFHSEAEGYRYFPDKLKWRVGLLEKLLADEFVEVENQIKLGQPLFAQHTGADPVGAQYICRQHDNITGHIDDAALWDEAGREVCQAENRDKASESAEDYHTTWGALRDKENFYIKVCCGDPKQAAPNKNEQNVSIHIEARRLGPSHVFYAGPSGETNYTGRRSGPAADWQAAVQQGEGGWSVVFTIPILCIDGGEPCARPLRFNVCRTIPGQPTRSWVPRRPVEPRLLFGNDDPKAYGWLIEARGETRVKTQPL